MFVSGAGNPCQLGGCLQASKAQAFFGWGICKRVYGCYTKDHMSRSGNEALDPSESIAIY